MNPLFVAEIGSNHKGIKALAFEMIRQASFSGADIAKFQLGHDAKDPIRGAPMEWVDFLDSTCKSFGIEFMASIWNIDGLRLARLCNMKRYKMAHQLIDRYPRELISYIIDDKKQVFASCAPNTLSMWHDNVDFIYCTTDYPTYDNLYMPHAFGKKETYYGYSDHTHGIGACLLAVSRGALYIEKHFTLDKTEESIRDNAFSADPKEFSELVHSGKEIARWV